MGREEIELIEQCSLREKPDQPISSVYKNESVEEEIRSSADLILTQYWSGA